MTGGAQARGGILPSVTRDPRPFSGTIGLFPDFGRRIFRELWRVHHLLCRRFAGFLLSTLMALRRSCPVQLQTAYSRASFEEWDMRKGLIAVGLSAAVLAATSSAASAGWHHGSYYHRGPGPVLGLVGGVIVGVATIATLPFAILGAAVSPSPPPPPPAYYGPPQQQGYYSPPPQQGYYGPPPQQGYYGPPQGYNAPPPQQGYYGPPPAPYSGY
jgi:hypothetical protein